MSKEKTQFTSESQPKSRGRSFKNKLLDSIREESLAGVSTASSLETAEKAYLSHIAKRAFDIADAASPVLLKELLSKSYSSMRATLPSVEFEFDSEASPAEQVTQIMKASSLGFIPPDVAATFISSVKSCVDIEAATDLKRRIEQLEEMLGAGAS